MLEIARRLDDAGYEAWCVGGALRDALLGGAQADFDLATSATPEMVQRLFPRRTVAVGLRFGTVGVLDGRRVLHEVTTFRKDVETDGRHAVVAYGVALEDDLARRDFTINALAYHPLRAEWRDPFDGAADLARGLVRAVGEPATRFREDYLRILRALRFAARFGFTIEPATWDAARTLAPGLERLSAERVRDEWFKGLRTAQSVAAFVGLWQASGAAARWVPELRSETEVRGFAGLGAVPPGAPRDPVLLTVLLTIDPVRVLRRLRASNDEVQRAAAVVAAPAEPTVGGATSDAAVRRWLAAAGPAADDLAALDVLRRGAPAPWMPAVAAIRARGEPLSRRELAVTGSDLQAIGVPRGPALGRLLDELLEVVLEHPELNTREALLARAREAAGPR
ncbi:MAG TPA: CCA tRNA nucleotidyltransferase [Gemmatimonadales bacterium]|nr:CCA tRNA nucleotidyltransferase [Gemmatimonadales bacterium]